MSMIKKLTKNVAAAGVLAGALVAQSPAMAEDETPYVSIKRLTLESALVVAQGAIDACREKGIQIGVTVLDRGGNIQAQLRDVLAPDLTLDISRDKAYTALSFSVATSAMKDRQNTPMAAREGLAIFAGGLTITAGGELVGAVGVSGAPGGEVDEECAQSGVDAITEVLEFAG